MKSVVYKVIVYALLFSVVPAHASFVITPTFDSTITSDPNAASIEAVIDSAVQAFENTFSNAFTAKIYFQEGGGLGESNYYVYDLSYSTFHSNLVANNANPAAIAGLDANGGNGVDNPVTNTSTIEMKSANMRALGIDQAPNCVPTATGNGTSGGNVPNNCGYGSGSDAYDGIVSLNTAITTPGSTGSSNTYSLLATVEHEIDEVLGLGSALTNCNSCTTGSYNSTLYGDPAPEDLFRYDAISGGTRTMSTNCSSPSPAYFSYGTSTAALAQFNNACNGADFGDWSTGTSAQVQDAFATPGANPILGPNEIAALSAIGYIPSSAPTPEPGLFFPVAGVLAIIFVRLRDRTARRRR